MLIKKQFFVFSFFLLSYGFVDGQNKVIKYYDANWIETVKEKAIFYADFIKKGENYNCISYWTKSNILRGESTYPDTVMQSLLAFRYCISRMGMLKIPLTFKIIS